jgi:hypothetical protein
MTATVTIETADHPVEVQKVNPYSGPPVQRIGGIITVPPRSKLVLHVFETQGLAMREKPA